MKKITEEVKKLVRRIEYEGIEYALLESKVEDIKEVDKKLYSAIIEYRDSYKTIMDIFKNKYNIDNILNPNLDEEQ